MSMDETLRWFLEYGLTPEEWKQTPPNVREQFRTIYKLLDANESVLKLIPADELVPHGHGCLSCMREWIQNAIKLHNDVDEIVRAAHSVTCLVHSRPIGPRLGPRELYLDIEGTPILDQGASQKFFKLDTLITPFLVERIIKEAQDGQ